MTMSTAPMASGGITPGAPGMTVQPMVRTRKKVPMNSAIYLRMLVIVDLIGCCLFHDGWFSIHKLACPRSALGTPLKNLVADSWARLIQDGVAADVRRRITLSIQ